MIGKLLFATVVSLLVFVVAEVGFGIDVGLKRTLDREAGTIRSYVTFLD